MLDTAPYLIDGEHLNSVRIYFLPVELRSSFPLSEIPVVSVQLKHVVSSAVVYESHGLCPESQAPLRSEEALGLFSISGPGIRKAELDPSVVGVAL